MYHFPNKEDTHQYDASCGNNPGEPDIGSLNAILDGRSGGGGPRPDPCRSAQSHPGARAICARTLWEVTTRSISWSCFWAMRSVEKRPFSPFMNVLLPLQTSSWRCLVAITCPLARPFLAFLPPSIKRLSRRCARSLRKTCCNERLLSPPPLGLWDRCGQQYVVVDVDGTKQAARQRA